MWKYFVKKIIDTLYFIPNIKSFYKINTIENILLENTAVGEKESILIIIF